MEVSPVWPFLGFLVHFSLKTLFQFEKSSRQQTCSFQTTRRTIKTQQIMPVKFEELEKSNVEPDLEEKLPEGFEEGDEKNEKMDDDDDDKDDPEENEDEMCASCQQMGLMEKIKKWIPKPLDKIFAICEFFSVDTKEEKIRKEKTMSGYAMYLVYFGYAFLFFAAGFFIIGIFKKNYNFSKEENLIFKKITTSQKKNSCSSHT